MPPKSFPKSLRASLNDSFFSIKINWLKKQIQSFEKKAKVHRNYADPSHG
jgi:hypothetical protein